VTYNFFSIVIGLETAHLFVESGSFHTASVVFSFFFGQDIALNSDSTGSDDVVTGDHADGYTSALNLLDSARHFRSHNIPNTEDADQGESRLLDILNVSVLGIVVFLTALVGHEIFVGESDCAESLVSKTVDNVIEFFFL